MLDTNIMNSNSNQIENKINSNPSTSTLYKTSQMHQITNNNNNNNNNESNQLPNISQNYLILNQLSQKLQQQQQQKLLLKQQQQQQNQAQSQQQSQGYLNSKSINNTNYIINCTTQNPKSESLTQIDNSKIKNIFYNENFYDLNTNPKKCDKLKPTYIQSVYEMDQRLLQKVSIFPIILTNCSFFLHIR